MATLLATKLFLPQKTQFSERIIGITFSGNLYVVAKGHFRGERELVVSFDLSP